MDDDKTSLQQLLHDLRTPLNAIVGYSELLIEEATEANNAQQEADLRRIHQAATTLWEKLDELAARLIQGKP
ncbi:MAG: histidine kinase dimerization/phospho-acceptor domain-containing protein [Polyangiales bacterium]